MTTKRTAKTSKYYYERALRQTVFAHQAMRTATRTAKTEGAAAAEPFLESAERYTKQAERSLARAKELEAAEKKGKR